MNGLYLSYKRQQEEKRQQRRLRDKYEIADSKVVVIEQKNYLKTVFFILRTTVKTVLVILLFSLATAGLIGIVYADRSFTQIADELFLLFRQIFSL